MEISPEKSEMMTFLGQDPLWITNGYNVKIMLKYLGCELSCENGKDISTKASKICSITGNSKQHFLN
jgi:hypothetical protein